MKWLKSVMQEFIVEPFREGEYLMGAIFSVIVIFVVLTILGLTCLAISEYQFAQLPVNTVKCQLVNQNYSPSTRKTQAVPVINSNGTTSVAVYSSGNSAKYSTVWKCGEYGTLISENKKLFRLAEDEMWLHIRHSSYATRIVGFEHE